MQVYGNEKKMGELGEGQTQDKWEHVCWHQRLIVGIVAVFFSFSQVSFSFFLARLSCLSRLRLLFLFGRCWVGLGCWIVTGWTAGVGGDCLWRMSLRT